MNIVTEHVYPPIPDRSKDWVAYDADQDELGCHGYGATETAALDDLLEQIGGDE